MSVVAIVLVVVVALLHLYFLVLEMFLWTRPLGLKVFRQTPEQADAVEGARRQPGSLQRFPGGGIAVGVATGSASSACSSWPAWSSPGLWRETVNGRIFLVQALPAVLAICALLLR